MSIRKSSGPGIPIPPPVIYMAAFAIGAGLNQLWPMPLLPGGLRFIAGLAVILMGGLMMPIVIWRFHRARTTLEVWKPASALITEGPYRYSRNPIYIALTLLYLGIGILIDMGWVLILAAPVLLVINLWVVRGEERHLEARFGEEYLNYKATVRRWI